MPEENMSEEESAPLIGEGARTHDTGKMESEHKAAEEANAKAAVPDPKEADPTGEEKKAVKEPEKKESLTGLKEKEEKPPTKKEPEKKDTPKFDQRLLNEKGDFDPKLAEEVDKEWREKEEKYNKRINDMRRMVSGKADIVGEKVEFFQDYVAPEKYSNVFSESASDKTKAAISSFQEKLADKYFEVGLNKKQGYEISNTLLEILEELKVVDARSPEQFELDTQEWIREQEKTLGENAKGIIKESTNWVLNEPRFSEVTKSKIIKSMDDLGSDFINVIYSLKEAHTGNSIPTNVSDLGGLPSDIELANEYLDAKTTPTRKEQITQQRAAAGRKGRLMDAVRNL